MLRDLRWVTLAETFSRLASLVTVPLLTRSLVPAEYGLYRGILLTISALLIIQSVTNIEYLLQKRIPEFRSGHDNGLATAATLAVSVLAVLSVVMLAVVTWLGALTQISRTLQQFVMGHLGLISGLLITNVAYHHLLTLTRSFDRFHLFSISSFLRETTFLIVVVFLFLTGALDIDRVVIGLALSNMFAGVPAVFGLKDIWKTSPNFEELIAQLRRVSLPLAPRTVIAKAASVGPDALVVATFGTATFGIWSLVFVFKTGFQFISQPFSNVLLPKISKRLNEEAPLELLIRNYYRVTIVLVAPGVLGGTLLGPDVIQYVFGEAFVPSMALVGVLCLSFGLETVNVITGHLFIASNRSVYDTYTQFAAAVTLGLFALVGVTIQSLLIVGVGYVASELVVASISLWYQTRFVELSSPSFGDVVRLCVSLGVMGLAVYIARPIVSGLLSLFAVIFLGGVIYIFTLLVIGFLTESDIKLVRRFVGV